ncbi:unnamed protein product, partial [Thlaspi arvense]
YGNSTFIEIDVLPWGCEGVLEYTKQNDGSSPIYIIESDIFLSFSISSIISRPTNHYSPLHDVEKVEYLHAYIAAMLNSLRNGSDTRGYFEWRFVDLFEFVNLNYTYGLYYLNFSNPQCKKSPKNLCSLVFSFSERVK